MDLQILEVTKLEEETGGAYRASAARGSVREMIDMCPNDFVMFCPPSIDRSQLLPWGFFLRLWGNV